VRTQMEIRTEADYLQAHLTVIEGESRARHPTLHNVKQGVTSILKQSILAAAVVFQLSGKRRRAGSESPTKTHPQPVDSAGRL
jgi:hypothetical protein